MTNIGVDTGFEAQGSPAEFKKSSNHLALCSQLGLQFPSCPGYRLARLCSVFEHIDAFSPGNEFTLQDRRSGTLKELSAQS